MITANYSIFGRKYFSPLSLNLAAYITSFNGVTLSGTNVVSLTDLTGNGNTFLTAGNPQILGSGINGVQSIVLNGTNRIYRETALTGITTDTNRSSFIVFKITDAIGVTYHNIILSGAISYTSSGSFNEQLYNPNSTNDFIHNFNVNTLDSTSISDQMLDSYAILELTAAGLSRLDVNNIITIGSGSQQIGNLHTYIGQWNSRGAKMLFCEYGVRNENFTTNEIANLKYYFKSKYNISSSVPSASINVYNRGANGNNTSDVIGRLTDINSLNADLAILMIGYNDWRHPTLSKRRTPAEYKTNLTTIITSLVANGSDVLIVDFPRIEPTESDYVCGLYSEPTGCDSNATANDFRTKIAEVVTEQSILYYNLKQDFIDIGQPNYTAGSYCENIFNSASTDGLHFRPSGALYCAEKLAAYILGLGTTYTNIVCVGDSQTYGDGLTGGGTVTGDTYPAKLKTILNS